MREETEWIVNRQHSNLALITSGAQSPIASVLSALANKGPVGDRRCGILWNIVTEKRLFEDPRRPPARITLPYLNSTKLTVCFLHFRAPCYNTENAELVYPDCWALIAFVQFLLTVSGQQDFNSALIS